ncbi:hypothetical protein ONS95_002817 [Cadophora gregata]|uniref:uncharacterized protein n=1 Tax=Cadophora gregata TaxID=51156 RepID=UPI0026DB222D|nr:uncharacterized protein ONS95_002817 [Cadophora gregata]KAK0110166.1 hypothetical protein ONS95_002817 [Cadophora gregata]KAK0110219.1 hypothetical protein ONS96_001842 [Cadophora gregata f. sp. sojae]
MNSSVSIDTEPLRVIIRVCVTDIPGEPEKRVHRLGSDFCEQIISWPFNNDLQDKCHDAMHFLPDFDSENNVRAWILYDFNVVEPLDKGQVLEIQHLVYHATRQGESWYVSQLMAGKLFVLKDDRIFTPRENRIPEGRKYCSMYTWGGSYKTE